MRSCCTGTRARKISCSFLPSPARSRPEFAKIVGCIADPVFLRIRIDGAMTLKQLLHQNHIPVLDALDHQDFPLAVLRERLQSIRELGRSALSQTVSFALHKSQTPDDISAIFLSGAESAQLDFGGLQLETYYIPQAEGQVELALEMIEAKNLLWGTLKYDADLFDAATVRLMQCHFETLLESSIADPPAVSPRYHF